MYGVESLSGSKWEVRDERGVSLFRGSMRQCEDWLDCCDNIQPSASAGTTAASRAPQVWRAIVGGILWATTVSLGTYFLVLYQTTAFDM
jgi:hypothetical protein